MKYSVGGRVITKKPHACGCNEWLVTRIGADVKLKCVNCGHQIFLEVDKVDKISRRYIEPERTEN
jgi:hypothetical protein